MFCNGSFYSDHPHVALQPSNKPDPLNLSVRSNGKMTQLELSIITLLCKGCALCQLLPDETACLGVNELIREGEGHCRRKITPALISDALKKVKALSLPVPRNPSPSSQFFCPWRALRAGRASNQSMSSLSHPDFLGNDLNG